MYDAALPVSGRGGAPDGFRTVAVPAVASPVPIAAVPVPAVPVVAAPVPIAAVPVPAVTVVAVPVIAVPVPIAAVPVPAVPVVSSSKSASSSLSQPSTRGVPP
jgi:hypothetical protein